jgi:serine phosphatase RsbU (regulator of sigma subunit)
MVLHVNATLNHYLSSSQYPCSYDKLKRFPEFLKEINAILGKDIYRLVHPIVFKKGVIGLFVLNGNKRSIPYTNEEKAFLGILIGQGSFAIENALLLEDLTQRERFQREIEIAGMVQSSLLPQENPRFKGLDIDGICYPAAEVGGDYYDFFRLDGSTIGVVIADVTGKGSSAAFYMAVVKGMMLSLTPIYTSPKRLLIELNKRLFGRVDRQIFVTMTYAVIDMRKRILVFSRAGHNALIVRKQEDSSVHYFTPDGIGLGLEKGKVFDKTISESKMPLMRGDLFLFYTDGVSEAMNRRKEEFGDERLMRVVQEMDQNNSEKIRSKIIDAVHGFTGDTPQHDDITLVTLTVT